MRYIITFILGLLTASITNLLTFRLSQQSKRQQYNGKALYLIKSLEFGNFEKAEDYKTRDKEFVDWFFEYNVCLNKDIRERMWQYRVLCLRNSQYKSKHVINNDKIVGRDILELLPILEANIYSDSDTSVLSIIKWYKFKIYLKDFMEEIKKNKQA